MHDYPPYGVYVVWCGITISFIVCFCFFFVCCCCHTFQGNGWGDRHESWQAGRPWARTPKFPFLDGGLVRFGSVLCGQGCSQPCTQAPRPYMVQCACPGRGREPISSVCVNVWGRWG